MHLTTLGANAVCEMDEWIMVKFASKREGGRTHPNMHLLQSLCFPLDQSRSKCVLRKTHSSGPLGRGKQVRFAEKKEVHFAKQTFGHTCSNNFWLLGPLSAQRVEYAYGLMFATVLSQNAPASRDAMQPMETPFWPLVESLSGNAFASVNIFSLTSPKEQVHFPKHAFNFCCSTISHFFAPSQMSLQSPAVVTCS